MGLDVAMSSVAAAGTFTLGANSADPVTVVRLGFGAMRIVGPGIWGDPADPAQAIAVLRGAAELGVNLIDTADSYGPFISEDLIKQALHPYDGILVATKGGLTRQGPDAWDAVGRAPYLRQCVQMSLRRLGVDRIDLWQLHRIDPRTPVEEQFGEIAAMQAEGLIRHVGLSEVSVADVEIARTYFDVVSVQNMYNVAVRSSEALVDYCHDNAMGFIPWFPLGNRQLLQADGAVARTAARLSVSPSQVALAWLLQRSPVILPIPGTGSLEHLRDNCGAADVQLDDQALADLSDIGA